MQVAFDSQMHELKLLMAADEKLWQLRGSLAAAAPNDIFAERAAANSPASLLEPSNWTAAEVRYHDPSKAAQECHSVTKCYQELEMICVQHPSANMHHLPEQTCKTVQFCLVYHHHWRSLAQSHTC